MMIRVILLNGPIDSGKDTAARRLLATRGAVTMKISDSLKKAVMAILGFDTLEQLEMAKQEDERVRELHIRISEDAVKLIYGQGYFGVSAARMALKLGIGRIDRPFVIEVGFQAEADAMIAYLRNALASQQEVSFECWQIRRAGRRFGCPDSWRSFGGPDSWRSFGRPDSREWVELPDLSRDGSAIPRQATIKIDNANWDAFMEALDAAADAFLGSYTSIGPDTRGEEPGGRGAVTPSCRSVTEPGTPPFEARMEGALGSIPAGAVAPGEERLHMVPDGEGGWEYGLAPPVYIGAPDGELSDDRPEDDGPAGYKNTTFAEKRAMLEEMKESDAKHDDAKAGCRGLDDTSDQ